MAKIIFDPLTVNILDSGHLNFIRILQDIFLKLDAQFRGKREDERVEGFSAVITQEGGSKKDLFLVELAWRGKVFAKFLHTSGGFSITVRSSNGNEGGSFPIAGPCDFQDTADGALMSHVVWLLKMTVIWNNREIANILGVPITNAP